MTALKPISLFAAVALAVACNDNDLVPTAPEAAVTAAPATGMVAMSVMANLTGPATIVTDKEDYVPHEPVGMIGAGWEPGETVTLTLAETPEIHDDRVFTVVADTLGNFGFEGFAPEDHHAGVTFLLTAVGQTSGLQAQATFTDAIAFGSVSTNFNGPGATPNSGSQQNLMISSPAASPGDVLIAHLVIATGIGTNDFICAPSSAWQLILRNRRDDKVLQQTFYRVVAAAEAVQTVQWSFKSNVSACGSGGNNINRGAAGGIIRYTGVNTSNPIENTGVDAGSSSPPFPAPQINATAGSLILRLYAVFKNTTVSHATVTRRYSVGSSNNPAERAAAAFEALQAATGQTPAFNATFGSTAEWAAQTIALRVAPDLMIDKSHAGDFSRGGQHEYVITVSNVGTAPTTADVVVRDTLPTGLTFVSGTGTDWSCGAAGAVVTCTRPAANTIAGGASAPMITLTVAVAAGAPASVTNRARVSGGGEGATSLVTCDGPNNCDADPTTIVDANAGPEADAGGPYTGAEGTAIPLSGAVASGTATPLTYEWSYAPGVGVDAGAACSFTPSNGVLNPSITCTDDGPFSLTLTVTDTDNLSASEGATLTVTNANPVADAGGPYSGDEGEAVQLTGTRSDPGSNDQLGQQWSFTPGAGVDAGATCSFAPNAGALNPTVACTDDGSYQLTLTVQDDDGGSHSDNATLTVSNVAPVADAGGPYSGNEGAAVQLNGSATDAGANDTRVWSWQYVAGPGVDAGATCSFSNNSAEDPTITCTDDGTVELTLTVTDDDGASHDDAATLTLANANPTADAGGPYSGEEGSAVALSGARSDPGSNDQLTQSWSYTPGSGVDAGATCSFSPNASVLSPSITCTDDGTFQLTLTVEDDDGGSDSETAELTLTNAGPVADAGGPYNGSEGSPVQLNGTVTDAGANDTHTWAWEYTAGPGLDAGGTCSFNNANAQDPTITCTDDGTVTLTLTVEDDDGAESVDQATLTLANVDPVANAGGPYTGAEGTAVQLNGSATDAGSNDTHVWSWQYVAGAGVDAGATCSFTSASAEDPKITCTDDGTVQLTLTVTDDDGGVGTDGATLTLTNVAPVANAGGPYSGNEGGAIPLAGSASDAGSNDVVGYQWTADVSGLNGGTCAFGDATAPATTINCTDNGSVQLTLTATDDDGDSDAAQATLTVANVNPVANAGGPYSGGEGAAIQLTGLKSDAGTNDQLTQQWTYTAGAGVDAGASCSFSPNASALSPTVTCTDDGSYQLTLTVSDDDGGTGGSNATLTVANAAPAVAGLTKPDGTPLPATLIVAGTINFRTSFSDLGANDSHTAEVDCGSGYTPVSGNVTSPFDAGCTFATIGPKTIQVKVTDDDGGYNVATHELVIKYNFDGFFAPVDRPNTMNVSKAGQAIPLKWRLTDANGVAVTDLVTVTVRAKSLTCNLGTSQDLLEEYAAGSSGLQNHGDGRYQFNWKTPTTYASSCKTIELVFGAGGLSYVEGPHAYFSFKK